MAIYPDKEAFDIVVEKIEAGDQLTLRMVGEVFGPDFYDMIIYSFLDAQHAARAIQLASRRLSRMEDPEEDE